jgi:site-specific recombinase XerD
MSEIEQSYSIAEEFQLFLDTDSAQKGQRSAKADEYFLGIVSFFFRTVRKIEYINQVRLEDLQLLQIWLAKRQELPGGKIKVPWADPTLEFYSRVLKKFFRKMFHVERIHRNPCTLWKVPKGSAIQRRPMTIQEFSQLHAMAPDWFKPILMFIRLTGSRGASVASLTWEDVHFDSHTLILRSRKGGLKQTKLIPIPMYPALFEFLEVERKKNPTAAPKHPVFWGPQYAPVTAQDITTEGSRLIKLVGLRGKVVLYSLRHALAAEMTAAGVPLEITRQAMGHSSINQTSHYAKGIASSVVGEAFAQIRSGIKKDET